MLEILSVSAACVFVGVITLTIRSKNPEMASLIVIACGTVLLIFITPLISQLISELSGLTSYDFSDEIKILIKVLGVASCVEIAADTCRDVGSTSLAAKLELFGRLTILLMAMPMLKKLLSVVSEISP